MAKGYSDLPGRVEKLSRFSEILFVDFFDHAFCRESFSLLRSVVAAVVVVSYGDVATLSVVVVAAVVVERR